MDAPGLVIKAVALAGVIVGSGGLLSLVLGGPVPPENIVRITMVVVGIFAMYATLDMLWGARKRRNAG